jgi:peptidoglycan/LPS O-acetylase OafA/YrhL
MVAVLIARTAFVLTTGNITAAGILTPFKIDSLMAGASVAVLMRSVIFRERALKCSPLVFGTVAVAALAYMVFDGNRESLFTCSAGFSILAMFFASLLVMAFRSETIKRFFSAPVLTTFGRYSYGLYVYHPIIYCWLHQRPVMRELVHLTHQAQSAQYLSMALLVVASMAVAALSFRFYEKPILNLKRYL